MPRELKIALVVCVAMSFSLTIGWIGGVNAGYKHGYIDYGTVPAEVKTYAAFSTCKEGLFLPKMNAECLKQLAQK